MAIHFEIKPTCWVRISAADLALTIMPTPTPYDFSKNVGVLEKLQYAQNTMHIQPGDRVLGEHIDPPRYGNSK